MSRQVDIKALVSHLVKGDGKDRCRICMGDTSEGQVFLGDTVMMDGDKPVTLAELLEVITGVEVEKTMVLPNSICRDCMDNINGFIPFIQLCKESINQWNRIADFFTQIQFSSKVKSLYITIANTIDIYKDKNPAVYETNTDILRQFKTKINRQKYYTKRLVKYKDTVENSKYKCPECNTLFKNVAMFNQHLENLKLTCCQHCYKMYNIESYKAHLERHNITTFSCKYCKFVFEKFNLLHKHVKKIHKGNIICPDCDRSFLSPKNLSAHCVKHKSHICSKCNQRFSNKICFLSHRKNCKTHGTFALYICDFCNKEYKSRGPLVNHITYNHMTGKRFQCDQCGKTFNSKAHLEEHGNTHEQVPDRHVCFCKAKFSSRRGYVRHLKKHDISEQ